MLGLNGKGKENRDKRGHGRAIKGDKGRKAAIIASPFAGLIIIPERASAGQAQDYGSIGEQLGYERHTVGKWFKQYSQQGLMGCRQMAMGKKSGSIIRGQALAELKEKLNSATEYFTSYKQIHQWLAQAHNIQLSYEHVHRFVRYYLKAKLKVVRKSNRKKDAVMEEKFKKN